MRTPKKRWEQEQIIHAFINSYRYIIPHYENKTKILTKEEAIKIVERNKDPKSRRLKGVWDKKTSSLVMFLYPGEDLLPISGFALKPSVKLSEEDLHFARAFSKVFNQDLSLCGDVNKTDEIWRALRITQFLRAISRFTHFKSLSVSRWIQTMESSMFLTYEGKSVEHIILLPYSFEQTQKKLKNSYIKLKKSITIEEALLKEKWIRTVVDGRRVALLATKKSKGTINGFISLPDIKGKKTNVGYAPHESLEDLQAVLEKNDMAFIAASTGDILILLGNGIVFNKTQGKWRYLNYNHFHQLLIEFVDEKVTNSIISSVLNLAFERKGALFVIPRTKQSLKFIVTDHAKDYQVNTFLRRSLKGLNITNHAENQIITSASGIDGALVLDSNGNVLDVGCMIGKANEEQMKKLGIENPKVFEGARTNAAWNASLFGIAIKISADGQIIVFSEGKTVWEIG